MRRGLIRSAILLALLAAPAPMWAWSKQSHIDIAWEAARLAPPDLFRQIVRHKNSFRDGLIYPFDDGSPERRFVNPDGTGLLDEVILIEADNAVRSITAHRPFQDIVFQLGLVLHYVLEANNPLQVDLGDPSEATYAADYEAYLQYASKRVPGVFYGIDPELRGLADLEPFITRTIDRSRSLYPYVGDEYRRVGGGPGVERFDDKSTAFGVASVAFNRALTDAVAVLRLVWLEAGGTDGLPRRSLDSNHLLKLDRTP